MNRTGSDVRIPGVMSALERLSLPHRIIAAQSPEDKELTAWTEAAFPWGFSQIDWTLVPDHRCVEYTDLEDVVAAFRAMVETLSAQSLVVVMWANGLCPLLEIQLGDLQTIATEIFEEHETSRDVFVFNRREGWLIEMHHEDTLSMGRSSVRE